MSHLQMSLQIIHTYCKHIQDFFMSHFAAGNSDTICCAWCDCNHVVEFWVLKRLDRLIKCIVRRELWWWSKIITWSVAISHSIAASRNAASEYGVTRSLLGISFRCLSREVWFTFSLAAFAAFGSIDLNLFSSHHALYKSWINKESGRNFVKYRGGTLQHDWLLCAVYMLWHLKWCVW